MFLRCERPICHSLPIALGAILLTLAVILPTFVSAQTPLANWSFDEGSGNVAFDSSGNARNATLFGGIQWMHDSDGWFITSGTGSAAYVAMPVIDFHQSNAASVFFWTQRYWAATGHDVLFASGDKEGSGFAIFPDDTSCRGIQAAVWGSEGKTANCYSPPSSGDWHQLAIVFDKTQTGGDAIVLYIDGAKQTPTRNLSSSSDRSGFGASQIYLFSQDGSSNFSSGSMRGLKVYDSALSASAIQQQYADSQPAATSGAGLLAGTAGLVASYAFDEGSGSTVSDGSGNGNTGTVANATWTTDGKFGSALSFNGSDSVVTVPDSVSLRLKEAMTLEAWVNPSVASVDFRDVIDKGSDYFLEGTSRGPGAPSVGATLTSSSAFAFGDTPLVPNAWSHLAVTYDGSSLRMFVNGRQVAVRAYQGEIASSTNPLEIGGDHILGQYFSGKIDEVRIYNIARTQAEIQSDMITPVKARLLSIAVSPQGQSIEVGEQLQLTATGSYSDGSQQDLTRYATWTSSALLTVSGNGIAHAVAVGNATVQAEVGFVSGIGDVSIGPASFSISASPSSVQIAQGSQGASAITSTTRNGFNSAVSLSASGVPSGTTVSFSPNPIPAPGAGSSTMLITVGANTAIGTYTITVTGMGGGIQTHTTTVSLTVTAPADFSISASPSAMTIAQGTQDVSTITTAISGGFNSAINLSASGVPPGTTVSFGPNPIAAPGNGSSAMTINVGANTTAGTYPIIVTGSGGGMQHSTTMTLTVTSTGSGIALDGNVHGVKDNGVNSSSSVSVSVGTPTAGDLITCEVTFDSGNNNALVSVSDNNNGTYAAAVPVHLNSSMVQWFGIYYKENVYGSATTITLTTTQSRPYEAISCQAWKGVAGANSLDTGFSQLQDAVSAPNPTTGSNKTPSANGELILSAAALINAGTPTPGSNYSLIDGATQTRWWPEYWIQTTATSTAGNYTWPTDTWTDMMAAFLPKTSGDYTITANPASVNVAQGSQGTSTIATTISGGFNNAISLSTSGVPNGTTVTFSPNPIAAPGNGSSTMTISVGANTAVGTYPITVTGSGGGVQHTTTVTLTVTAGPDYTITASPSSVSVTQGSQGASTLTTTISGGFNSAINLSASGVPNGTTVTFNPNPIAAPGSGTSVMTISVGANTATGTYPITVTGSGGGIQHTTTVTLTVTNAPDYTITANPSSVSVAQGNQGTSTITTTITGGFNNAINLSASGVPTGTTVTFAPNPIAAPGNGSSTMTINVGANTTTGTYSITVTGSGGGIQHTTTVTLTVTMKADYTISANPSSLSVMQGSQGISTITTTIMGGFNSAINLSASGVPTGTTVSFSPNPIAAPGNGSSVMAISVGANTQLGTYPITVTGNGGGAQHTTTVTLTVTDPPDYTITANPTSVGVVQGSQGTSTITTTIIGAFNSAINLSASGVPSGTTVTFSPNPITAPGNGSSAMTISVGANTAIGTYVITVTGSGGGIQHTTTVTLTVNGVNVGVGLDGGVHGVQDSGGNATNTESVSIGTPSAGDLIVCEVTFDSGNNNSLVSVSDNNNGTYAAAVPIHLNNSMVQWFGIYYKENVASSPTTVTLKTAQSQPYVAIACQAWKGVASANSLDTAFSQLQDAVSAPNPTTGSNKTPSTNGELVIAAVGLLNANPPTPGTNYSLIDGATQTRWWPEYWVQTTATPTAGNYTWPSDTWTDMMAAFKPASTGDFGIGASPTSISLAQGSQGTSTVTTTISGGFNSAISLTASGVPNGTTVSFSPNPIAAPGTGSSTMTLSVGANTAVGTYPITVTGSGGGVQHSTTVTLTVTAGTSFSISASPTSLGLLQGSQGTSTITTAISGGFNSAVTLTASGVPNGTVVSFSPNPIPAPGNGTSVMTITVGMNTLQGTYPIVITGSGGGVQQSVTLTLTVTANVMLSWDASNSQGVIGYNVYRGTATGGPYTKINQNLVSTTNYIDGLVQDGYTYYYVTTAVNQQQQESGYSNEASASVP